jgi:hypothetical protein
MRRLSNKRKDLLSIVTPLDVGSEDAAGEAAKAVIKKL